MNMSDIENDSLIFFVKTRLHIEMKGKQSKVLMNKFSFITTFF